MSQSNFTGCTPKYTNRSHQSKPTLGQNIEGYLSISSSDSARCNENQTDKERILNILM